MTDQLPNEEQPQTDEEWKEKLSAEEYRVLRERGTEPRFSSDLLESVTVAEREDDDS